LEYFGGYIIRNEARNWDSVAGQNWQAEQKEFHRLYAMKMTRRMVGTCYGVVGGVSRPPFIGQGRERRGHGRAGTAGNDGAAK
jgi:hypothetical protein